MSLEVSGLRVAFDRGAREVVRGIDLRIGRGEALGLIGASGSGKSLTAKALLGLVGDAQATDARVTAERMSLGETDLRALSERQWHGVRGKRIGLVLQDALGSLDPARTIGAELATAITAHAPRLDRAAVTARSLELLTRVGLPDPEVRLRQRADHLSGGQRQRALIATAIAHDPELLIADEPTTALDATARRELLVLLRSRVDDGMSVLVVSHDLTSVRTLCDRVDVIDDGAIVESGATARILAEPSSPQARALVAALPRPPRAEARPTGEVVLRAEHLHRTYPRPDGTSFTALRVDRLELRRGETLGVVGPSGSGKSTLARELLALERPEHPDARIELDGSTWQPATERARRPLRHRIGFVAQDPLATFNPRLRVGQILADALTHGRERRPGRRRGRIVELLREVGLDERHLEVRPARLSGGERQRLAIARALAAGPEVLLCDEAVSALDSTVRRQVLDLLARVQRARNLACVFISHDLDVVGEIADRVAVLEAGAIVEQGPTASLFQHPEHKTTRLLLGLGESSKNHYER
jgi:peptide/nickel transport system ATP-binding protein